MKKDNKGFTLAEMLIVVAIIGVLIAIVTTAVTSSLEKAREAVDLANIRNAYAEMQALAISKDKLPTTYMYGYPKNNNYTYIACWVKSEQKKNGWQSTNVEKDANGNIKIGDAYVLCPNVEKGSMFKLLYYVDQQAAKDTYNPEPFHFRVEAGSKSTFASKSPLKAYNNK